MAIIIKGKIAYLLVSGDTGYDANVQHGLIAATEDQTTVSVGIRWNEDSIGTSTGIGSGSSNTTAIIAGQGNSYAAGLARAYTGCGYTDWYLPSKDELYKLYLDKAAITGFANYPYWSSSEKNGTNSLYAWAVYFDTGFLTDGFPKSNSIYVRAVRSF